jgi:DNA (cytosine-5)-methyltransferase 1
MRYLSVCSGIEAATVAWHHMGWTPVAFSEIEKFPSQVLNHHYQSVPNVGDMTKFEEWNLESVELLVGGTPCQSFSVAGLRKGLDDPRGNLMLTYGAIAKRFKPKWLVWENVPGVLSSNGGRDFGTFLGMLAELGYGFAYRVLDAQYFGVAQRRRRVFVVGHLGDWRRAASVLFEPTSLRRDTAPSREKGEAVANCLTKSPSSHSGANPARGEGNCILQPVGVPDVMSTLLSSTAGISRPGNSATEHETYIPMAPIPYDLHQVTAPVNRQAREAGDPCHTLAKQNAHNAGIVQPLAFQLAGDRDNPSVSVSETAFCLPANPMSDRGQAVAQPIGTDCYNGSITGDIACTMGTPGSSVNASGPTVMQHMAVRRLTPVECERLQGFPDGYTNIRENCPDGPRYKALGNSMAVPVMKWIGQRIQTMEGL